MEIRSTGETKKAVCRVLTNVIKASPLRDAIDPKAFFMMINTNFPVIYQGSRLELGLIWDALCTAHPPQQLYGIFLKFEEASASIGLTVGLPLEVAQLSDAQRHAHIQRFNGHEEASYSDPSGLTPLIEIDGIGEQPLPLSTGDLKPLVSDDLKRRVAQSVVNAVKSAPISSRIESAQLAYWCHANFDTLCDGQRFSFDPLLTAFRALGDVADSDLYFVVLELQRLLQQNGILLDEPELAIGEDVREALAREHTRRVKEAEPATPSGPRAPASGRQPPSGEHGAEPAPKKDKLEKWGLKRQSAKSASGSQYVRIGLLSAVFVACIAYAWLTRPNRELDPHDYDAVFPLKAASLVAGAFQGTIDEALWRRLDYAGREKAVKGLQDAVRERGLLTNLQIRDSQKTLVIVSAGPRLVPSRALMREGLRPDDKTIPKEEPPVPPLPVKKPQPPVVAHPGAPGAGAAPPPDASVQGTGNAPQPPPK